VVFGGASPDGTLGDTWGWNGSDWVDLAPQRSPSARSSPGLAYDPSNGLMLLGGEHGNKVLHGTWVL
jgi:hypothetical protein